MKNLCIIFLLLPLFLSEFGMAETTDESPGYPSQITRLKTDGTQVYLSTSQTNLLHTYSVIYDVTSESIVETIRTVDFTDYIILDDMIWILVDESEPIKSVQSATHVIGYLKSNSSSEARHMVFRNESGLNATRYTIRTSARGVISIAKCNTIKFSYVLDDPKPETTFFEIPIRYYSLNETFIASLDTDAKLISIFDLNTHHEYHMPAAAFSQYPQSSKLPQGVFCNDGLIYLQEDGIYLFNFLSQRRTKLVDVQSPEYFYIKGVKLYVVGDNGFLMSMNINSGEIDQYSIRLTNHDRFVITNDSKLYIISTLSPTSSNTCLVIDLIKNEWKE